MIYQNFVTFLLSKSTIMGSTPQGWDSVKVLDEHHFKQNHGSNAGMSVICTINVFHEIINMGKIHSAIKIFA